MPQIMVFEFYSELSLDLPSWIFERIDCLNCPIGKTVYKICRGIGSMKYLLAANVALATYEMAKDEARHGKAFEGMLKRYFGK